jgi:raffinose/stachyose/melibiose transport system permease protein
MNQKEKTDRLPVDSGRLAAFVILLAIAAVWVYPIANAVFQSLKIRGFGNYLAVIQYPRVRYFRVVANSFFIATATSCCVTLIASLGAYAFSKLPFRGSAFLYVAILACLAVPPAAMMSPLFISIKQLGLMNRYASLILPLVAFNTPFMLMILKNYFDTIPDSLLEAARLDGASRNVIYRCIIMPLGIPAIVNTLVLTFIYSWNDFLIPLLFVRRESMYTVTLAASFFMAAKNQTPEMVAQLYAALVLMTVPSILIYLAGQRYFVGGLTAGAVKQ